MCDVSTGALCKFSIICWNFPNKEWYEICYVKFYFKVGKEMLSKL